MLLNLLPKYISNVKNNVIELVKHISNVKNNVIEPVKHITNVKNNVIELVKHISNVKNNVIVIKEEHDSLEFTKPVSTLQASSSKARLNKLKVYKEYKN